jgi:hypothetical protein
MLSDVDDDCSISSVVAPQINQWQSRVLWCRGSAKGQTDDHMASFEGGCGSLVLVVYRASRPQM